MGWDQFMLSHARVSSKRHKRVTLDDKMAFFQQLGSLVASGSPILQGIQIAAEQTQSDKLRTVLEDIAARVAAGLQLHQALAEYEHIFEPHWIAMVGTGEVSGKMQQVLLDLNTQIRDAQETRRKLIGSLTYPFVLLLVSIAVIVVMLWFVVPTFGDMFEEMNADLPDITQWVLQASDVIAAYGLYGIGGVIVAVFLARRYLRTDSGLRRVKATLLAMPLFGELIVQVAMYRFSSNLALLLKSGIPIMETLTVMGDVFRRDPAYSDAIAHARNRVAAGRSLAESLEESGLFTSMMINAVSIGEKSANLGPVMEEIAPYYKEKMNAFLAKVTKLLEPCIIMGMGGTIAVVMLAIYVPMFEMAGKVN